MADYLLFNIGNTHTQWVFADACGNFCSEVASVDTSDWMQDLSLLPEGGDCQVWAACVVPAAGELLTSRKIYSNIEFITANKATAVGLDFSQVDSSTLGADRIANAAALLEGELPAVCFDCGTAITMEVVLDNGVFAGGAIMPGRKLMRKSLAAGTALLPDLPLSEALPEKFGKATLPAMALGIDRGAVGMIRELMSLSAQYNIKRYLAAGGDAAFFCRAIEGLELAGDLFTLRGVFAIACHYAKKA